MYEKSEIRRGLFMKKDCADAIVITKSKPPQYGDPAPALSDISQRLERVRKKLAVVAQVVAANRGRR